MENKTDLRLRAKSIRKTLDIPDISIKIASKIRELQQYKHAKNVMLYYPMKYELNLLPLLEDDKNFYLPAVYGENLLVCPYKNGDSLKTSVFGTKEPSTEPVLPEILDLVIVPALAADKNNFRLGYGGGFYDRFLARNKIYSIAPVPAELFINHIPAEKFDIPVDIVVTD